MILIILVLIILIISFVGTILDTCLIHTLPCPDFYLVDGSSIIFFAIFNSLVKAILIKYHTSTFSL